MSDAIAAFSAGVGLVSVAVGVLWHALRRAQRQLLSERGARDSMRGAHLQTGSPMVLVVDDNDADRALFVAALEPLNVRVIEAASAEQALAMHAAQQWAVIVVDAKLPGLSGPDLIKRLRAPAVLLSGMDESELRKAAESCGADWMQKRGDINAMRTAVARLLR